MAAPAKLTAYRVAVLLAALGLYAYYNSLHGAFILDDVGCITADPLLGKPLRGVLKTRPVVSLTLTANYLADGLNPRGYHALNLFIHGLAALTLYGLTRRTLLLNGFAESRAAWAALVFAALWYLHPIQTQSVTYVVQRCESLMGLFFLLTFYCYVRACTGDRRWFIGAVAACFLGAGCKEMMVAVPPLLLLYDRTFLSGSWAAAWRARWKQLLVLSIPPALGAAYILLGGLLSDQSGTVGFGVKLFTPKTYLFTQSQVILHYLHQIVWPRSLCLDYLDWPAVQSLSDCLPEAAAVVGLLAITAVGVVRRTWWGFCGAWFFLILAPTSSILPLQDPAFEHRLYLPLAAVLALPFFPLAARVPARFGKLAVALGLLVAIGLGFLSMLRNETYASAATMWADVVQKRPGNYRARWALASELSTAGQTAAAAAQVEAAKNAPLTVPAARRLEVLLRLEQGDVAGAAIVGEELLPELKNDALLRTMLGVCRLLQNRDAEAEGHFRVAVELLPADRTARVGWAESLRRLKRDAEADAAVKGMPGSPDDAARGLDAAARQLALYAQATPEKLQFGLWHAEAACRLTPKNATALDTRGILEARLGRFDDAAATATAAASLAGEPYHAGRIARRAALYRAKKPYSAETLSE